MTELNDRLVECFRAVFPTLGREEIIAARVGVVEGWDSVATATLVSLVEQELGIELPVDDLGGLDSFEAFSSCVGRVQRGASR